MLDIQRKPLRDSQRLKMYKWERELRKQYGVEPTLSMEECAALVKKICKDFFGVAPRVTDGRGRRSACYKQQANVICLPKWSRSAVVVCHEVAHWVYRHNNRVESHGAEFMRTFIEILAIHARSEIKASKEALIASAIDSRLKVAEDDNFMGFSAKRYEEQKSLQRISKEEYIRDGAEKNPLLVARGAISLGTGAMSFMYYRKKQES